jgi:O-acetylserine/cysteine efflux transporter
MDAGAPALTLVATRFFVGCLFLLPFVKPPRGEWLQVFLVAITLFALPLALTNYAIKHIDASIVALASQLEVPFAWILSVIFLKEKISLRQSIGLLISFLGIYLLTKTPEVAKVENIHALIILIFVSFSYGVASIQLKFLRSNAATITVWSFFFSFLLTAAAALYWEPFSEMQMVFLPLNLAVTILTALLSMYAFYLWTVLVSGNEVTEVVPMIMLVPVSTMTFAYLLLGETTDISAILGGAVTIVGVGLQTLQFSRKN